MAPMIVAESVERAWIDFVRSFRLEDGLRYVLDNELYLHDMWTDGNLSADEISRLAREHWLSLINT